MSVNRKKKRKVCDKMNNFDMKCTATSSTTSAQHNQLTLLWHCDTKDSTIQVQSLATSSFTLTFQQRDPLATSRHHPYATNITCTMAGDAWSIVLRAQWGRPQLAWHFVNNSSQQQLPYSTNSILDKSTVAYVNFYQKLYENTPLLCLFLLLHSPFIYTHAFYQPKTVSEIRPCMCCTNINIILSSLQNVKH